MATSRGVSCFGMIFSSLNNGFSRRLIPQSCNILGGGFPKVLVSSYTVYVFVLYTEQTFANIKIYKGTNLSELDKFSELSYRFFIFTFEPQKSSCSN